MCWYLLSVLTSGDFNAIDMGTAASKGGVMMVTFSILIKIASGPVPLTN
jgi:hypothetical protein